jgi:hypothetical protein
MYDRKNNIILQVHKQRFSKNHHHTVLGIHKKGTLQLGLIAIEENCGYSFMEPRLNIFSRNSIKKVYICSNI